MMWSPLLRGPYNYSLKDYERAEFGADIVCWGASGGVVVESPLSDPDKGPGPQ